MNQQAIAIIIAGALIAAAIALTNHWALVAHNENLLRLNRWTGVVGMCVEAKPVAKGTEAYDPKTGERLMLRNNEWVNVGPNRAQRRRVDPRRIS
jgi:hypothetical protein